MQRQGHLGITAPISTAPPTARDLEVTRTLLEELKARNTYEGSDEGRRREMVLGRLNALVKEFVYKCSIQVGFTEAKAREAGGKIFTFGSYRLGVHGPGADIDTLCVVPRHIDRDMFFTVFEDMLRATDGVTEVTGVKEAYVPLITSVISGIDFDILLGRLALPSIPENLDLQDDNLLKNLTEGEIRCLNGSRVTDQILNLVPNVPVFREALRTIKYWAARRAIYGNVMGFCGGVAWAMLVARICQLYPNGCAGSIISRFFIIYYQWSWPQPILLKDIEVGPLQVRVWNPKLYPSDRSHRMPIITPAYPSMCATHNVTVSTQNIMAAEFKRAADIVDKIFTGTTTWSELFQPHDFFSKYRYYLQITASSGSAEAQAKWSGTVESKVRHLIIKLEYVESLMVAHPFVKNFERVNHCVNDEEVHAVSIGEAPAEIAKRTAADIEGVETASTVWTTTFYIGLAIEKKTAGALQQRRLDISYPTLEFTKIIKAWEGYDESTMGVIVRYIKSSALPSYVFDGQAPPLPKQLKRKTPKAGADAAAAKNAAHESDDQPSKKLRSSSFIGESVRAGGSVPPSEAPAMLSPAASAQALAAADRAINGVNGAHGRVGDHVPTSDKPLLPSAVSLPPAAPQPLGIPGLGGP